MMLAGKTREMWLVSVDPRQSIKYMPVLKNKAKYFTY